jgi:ABC-type nitrate/sulfonate/bicarbonate transport system permease component
MVKFERVEVARPTRVIYSLAGPVLIVALWQAAHMVGTSDPTLLPGPGRTMRCLLLLISTGEILPHIEQTLLRMAAGYLLAMVTGVSIGLIIGVFRPMYYSFMGVIDFFRSTPVTALYPMFVLLFGVKHLSKIAMVFWACFFVIALNSAYGAIQAGRIRFQMARLYGASRWQTFTWVTFFDALPQTMIGLRVAISYALIVEILCEMFMGSQYGLGQRVTEAYTTYTIDTLYALILLTGTFGYLLNRFFVLAEHRLVPWVNR